jgi:hypothetical protein
MKSKHLIFASLLALACTSLYAVVQPDLDGPQRLIFKKAELAVSEQNAAATAVASPTERIRAQRLGAPAERSHMDLRTGRFVTLTPVAPLLPGKGFGNRLTWDLFAQGEPRTLGETQDAAWSAFRAWLAGNADNLRIDPSELPDSARVTVLTPDHINIYVPRRVAGYPVKDSHLTATIKYGNLVMVSAYQWGDVDTSLVARLSESEASDNVQRHAGSGFPVAQRWKASEMMWVPVTHLETVNDTEYGRGLSYRLAWMVRTTFGEDGGAYEAVVDAVDGEVLAIQDTRHFVATPRHVDGGAFPVSNDGIVPDGVEVPDSPMGFAFVTTGTGQMTTDEGGNLPLCADGNITTQFTGSFVTIVDSCGAHSLTSGTDVDWGVSAGTNCTTPGIGGAGNTHASRTGFFELNQLKAMARGQLPNNDWLRAQLTSNMNLNQTCNAFWGGGTVNFYRQGGGCFNTGELAGVFDHEWGHGMDNNDSVPQVSSPGEGIADIYASLRLDDSCIGRHFTAGNCGGYGNACLSCTGIREIDWDKHNTHLPFGMANADACGPGNNNGPCGGSVHCEGQIYSQSVWDLWNRDLVGAPWNRTLDVARELATQLTYRGASGVQTWFACTPGTGGCTNAAGCGCAGTSGYQQYLLADDDNGNLNDGTPHMGAIFAAFSRHGIACTTPTVTSAGCSGTPTQVPVVTATAIDRGAVLTWTASAGATGYRVYRTDGVFNCSFGKELLGTTTALTFTDTGLKNGRNYYYQVVPMGAQDECFQVSSSCTAVTPVTGPSVGFASATVLGLSGDGDAYVDNCESTRVTLPVSNTGAAGQTNLRITAISSPSHPSTFALSSLPLAVSASLASCTSANAVFDIQPAGLDPGETLVLEVSFVSDQMTTPRVATVNINGVEGDLQNFPSKTFTFEASTESWQTLAGTWARSSTGGGGSGTTFYMKSSEFLDNQCDVLRSPVIRLNADSTMTMQNQFGIEAFDTQWWDRANISARALGSTTRTVLSPSGGRTYNATGVGGSCGTDTDAGWAGVQATWGASTWTSAALQTGTLAGQLIQLEVRYGTDTSVNGLGFHFDEVNVTNVDMEAPDTQSNTCSGGPPPLFADGFESGNTSAWSSTVP